MSLDQFKELISNVKFAGPQMYGLMEKLYPICRSITGNGVRQTLNEIKKYVDLQIHEIPTNTNVFDWTIPKEWNIRDAWIKCQDGKKYCDFKKNNLHIVNYSKGIHASMDFDELNKHLFFHTEFTNAIPYLTSYYKENWGFCLTKEEYDQMPKTGNYEVFIDAEHKSGSLTYGELLVPGRSEEEILISTYLCHPSLANNELSGPLLTAFLYKSLIEKIRDRYYSYRFLVAPETIGVIAFLAEKGAHLRKLLKAGLVVTCEIGRAHV